MNLEYKAKLETLAKAMLSKGIPPFMVASNIMEPEYQTVELWKDEGRIFVRTEVYDPDDNTPMWFLYTYEADGILLRIEHGMGGRKSIFWDRGAELKRLAEEVALSKPR